MTKNRANLIGLALELLVVGVVAVLGVTHFTALAATEGVSVTACKVEDADGDLATADDRTAIAGWQMVLLTNGEEQQPYQQTGADGCYTWTNLEPGVSYGVKEVVIDNWFNLVSTSQEFGPAAPGETYSHTFVNSEYAVTSGYKWDDFLADGLWDQANEPALPGWSIELWDVSDVPFFVASGTTDGSGKYEFTHIVPGTTYATCELLNFTYVQTYPTATTPHPDPPEEVIFDCTVLGQDYGPYGYQFYAESGDGFSATNFGNMELSGCTLTQGYWKTHSTYGPAAKQDDGWYTSFGIWAPGLEGPDAQLFDAQFKGIEGILVDMRWIDAFNYPPSKSNAWFILAHQWMAAYLNYYNGAGAGGVDVLQWISDGAELLDKWDQFDGGTPLIPKDDGASDAAVELAGWLDMYNSGVWGPGLCED